MNDNPRIGDKIKILVDPLEGARAYIAQVNREHNTITAMIPAGQIHPDDRKKFVVKQTRHGLFVPMQLLAGEWEPYGKRLIIS